MSTILQKERLFQYLLTLLLGYYCFVAVIKDAATFH
jgi:hypothetical protein